MRRAGLLRNDTLRLLGGPLLWAAHFLALYIWHAVVCEQGGASSTPSAAVLTALAVAAVLGLVWLLVRDGREEARGFIDKTGATLALASLVAILWTGLSAALIPECAGF